MRKRILCFIVVLLLASCQSVKIDYSNFTWVVIVEKAIKTETLSTVNQITQYDGTKVEEELNYEATENNSLILVELNIEKQTAGGDSFVWSEIYIIDQDKNTYHRIRDGFISVYGYDQLSTIDLKIGKHKGWIAFEIPTSKTSKLELVYESADGTLNFPLDY